MSVVDNDRAERRESVNAPGAEIDGWASVYEPDPYEYMDIRPGGGK